MHLVECLPALLIIFFLDICWVNASNHTTTTLVQVSETEIGQQQQQELFNTSSSEHKVQQTGDFKYIDLELGEEHGSGEVPNSESKSEISNELDESVIPDEHKSEDVHDKPDLTDHEKLQTPKPTVSTTEEELAPPQDHQEKTTTSHIPIIDNDYEDINYQDLAPDGNMSSTDQEKLAANETLDKDNVNPEKEEEKTVEKDAQTEVKDVHQTVDYDEQPREHEEHAQSPEQDVQVNELEELLPAIGNTSAVLPPSDQGEEYSGDDDPETVLQTIDASPGLLHASGDISPEASGFAEDSEPAISLPLSSNKDVTLPPATIALDPTRRPVQHVGSHHQRLKCQDVACDSKYHLRVSTSSSGGLTIPSGTVLVIRCTARTYSNVTANLTWQLPPSIARELLEKPRNDSLSAEMEMRVTESEDTLLFAQGKEQLTIRTLTVANVTEGEAGKYTCFALLPQHCCQRNVSLEISIYGPPSYAAEYAIVGAVCFLELLIILYFRSKSNKNKRKANTEQTATNGHSDYQRLPVDPPAKEKFEEAQQPLNS